MQIAGVILGVIALFLGTWGWSEVHRESSVLEDLYRALQLFVLHMPDLAGLHIPAQLEVARFLAPIADAVAVFGTVRTVSRYLRRRARLARFARPVIVCGAGVNGARLADTLSKRHEIVLIDADEKAPGLHATTGRRREHLSGDAIREEILRSAGIRKAKQLVVVTGDDFVNSQIVSTVRSLARDGELIGGLEVLAQVEDPSLAHFLEEPEPSAAGRRADHGSDPDQTRQSRQTLVPPVHVFSAHALAARALFGECLAEGRDHRDAVLAELEQHDAPHLLLAGDHPLLESIVLAALRRRRALILRHEADPTAAWLPPFRISLLGPDAVSRVEWLTRRWLPEPEVMELDARDVAIRDEQAVLGDAWIQARRDPGHALVACEEELDGIRLTLALSRSLSPAASLTRITTQSRSALDRYLQEHTQDASYLAAVTVRSLADLAWGEDDSAIERVSLRSRLRDALRVEGFDQAEAKAAADWLFDNLSVGLHSDPAPRIPLANRPLLKALVRTTPAADPQRSIPLSGLVRAGITVDLRSPHNLHTAAMQLAEQRAPRDAFAAWCEYVRHAPMSERSIDSAADDPVGAAVLALAAAAGGDRSRLGAVTPEPTIVGDARRITIFSGGSRPTSAAEQERLKQLFSRALLRHEGLVITAESDSDLPALVHDAARIQNVAAVTYGPRANGGPMPTMREVQPIAGVGEDLVLAIWGDILAAGFDPRAVRIVALAGEAPSTAQLLLARALGAKIAWLDPASERGLSLDDELPLGADGVVELPLDAMTLRSFISWPPIDVIDRQLRQRIARYLHNAYREQQRERKQADDPALLPWERLLPALQRSNLAAADDVPNKLQLIGKRLDRAGERLELTPTQMELLAEVEHGRYNYERLSAGWQLGQRHVVRLLTPHLKPWDALTDEVKQWDRDAVLNVAAALEEAGWGVRDLEPAAVQQALR